MVDRLAPPEFRVLAPRAVLLGAGNPAALQNVNTTELPNGSLCWVQDQFGLYALNKTSVAPPSGTSVVQPASGPGRWVPALAPSASPIRQFAALSLSGDLVFGPNSDFANLLTSTGGALFNVALATARLPGSGLYVVLTAAWVRDIAASQTSFRVLVDGVDVAVGTAHPLASRVSLTDNTVSGQLALSAFLPAASLPAPAAHVLQAQCYTHEGAAATFAADSGSGSLGLSVMEIA